MELIRARRQKLSMDLAPLIDVVFQLLVFFMLTSTFANPAIKLELPTAGAYDRTEDSQHLVVSVDEAGQMFVNDKPTDLERFPAEIEDILRRSRDKSVYVRGHKDMPYETFVKIMDQSKRAGAVQINILHQED
ncbi:MAG: biopolymer transporter ExbD [Candidatus Omnitrophica bacterium]|nr:biopolymer transporter ExbD [Candidatus Omnitrophota bacterium]